MDVHSLRQFLAVVDEGTVTAAAERLHLTQSALSRQLRAFERDLGMPVFDRRDQRLVLNSSGRQFLPTARELVAHFDQARSFADDIAAGALAGITLTATGTTLRDVIAPFLATWGPDDPVPTVWEERPAGIYRTLGAGADLAVGPDSPPDDLASLALVTLPLWAYVPADHPWADRESIGLRELLAEPLLVPLPGHQARRALDLAVEQAGIGLGPVVELNTPEIAQALASAGRGIAVVTDDTRFDLHGLRIRAGRRSVSRSVSIVLSAAWRRDHHAADQLEALAARLRAFSRQRYQNDDDL